MKDFASYVGFLGAALLQCWNVHAQDCEPGAGYISLRSESDLDEITSCSTFNGDISVWFEDSEWNSTTVYLGDIEKINGTLNIYPNYNYDVVSVVAPNLRNITNGLTIYYYNTTSQISLVNATFPRLEYIGGAYVARVGSDSLILEHADNLFIDGSFRVWDSMMTALNISGIVATSYQFNIDQNPSLFSLEANTLERVGDSDLYIGDNQVLERIEFNNLIGVNSTVSVTLNPELEKIEFPKLEYASDFQFTENGRQVQVSLPNVREAGNRNNTDFLQSQFSDVVKLDLGSLVNVTGGIIFSRNIFSSLVLPSLKNMTGELTIEENQVLDTLALPRLDQLGGLVVRDSEMLSNVTANSLRIAKSFEMIGNFTNVEFFALEEVTGDFVLEGDPSMDCSWFDEHLFQKIVKGSYSCEGNHTKPEIERRPSTGSLDDQEEETDGDDGSDSSADSSTDKNPSEPSTGGLSTGAKAGIGAGSALGGIAVLGALLYMFWWRRRKGMSSVAKSENYTGKPELDGTISPGARDEMLKAETKDVISAVAGVLDDGKPAPAELSSGIMELDGRELRAEMGGNEVKDKTEA
ncbi:hypothetical protein B0J13DRAFT_646455 [Dactylonectria estremocensis]|uniref:Sporulation-specific protein Sps2p n=1 Tax=Dactylonectria estremocensis TaxID=1079267 RepID=A0A9P9DVC8_9HYPO|nr:hypothetical protein B0J13DRAFT_646455 [Dactylonectria estremocensis]